MNLQKACVWDVSVGTSVPLFDDLPPENVTTASGDGGVASRRKRNSPDTHDEDAPATKMKKIWGKL